MNIDLKLVKQEAKYPINLIMFQSQMKFNSFFSKK